MIEVGDTVKLIQDNQEIYSYLLPEYGTEGIVKVVTYNVGIMQMLGVHLDMCIVEFPQGTFHVYTEDLKLIKKGNGEIIQSQVEELIDVNVN